VRSCARPVSRSRVLPRVYRLLLRDRVESSRQVCCLRGGQRRGERYAAKQRIDYAAYMRVYARPRQGVLRHTAYTGEPLGTLTTGSNGNKTIMAKRYVFRR